MRREIKLRPEVIGYIETTVMKWIERSFDFATLPELLPNVLERLRGTPARLEEKLRHAPVEVRTRRDGEQWSMQEHAGHLLDLDELHFGRLLDYEAGKEVLRAADMENRKTYAARHNERPFADLCTAFRVEREKFVAKLEGWPQAMWARSALHPRLRKPMRVIDLCVFVAEHDDHHLMRMTEIEKKMIEKKIG